MKRLFNSALLLLTGVVLGWWLHGPVSPAAPKKLPVIAATPTSPFMKPAPELSMPPPDNIADPSPLDFELDTEAIIQHFRQLLNQQDFDQALAFYEQALILDDAYQVLLKPVLEGYLKTCILQCSEGVFIALVDAWLASYYEDIPVLLLLADYQRLQGFPEEAAKVLHSATTYAYQPNQRERVTLALRRLVQSTDDYLSGQQRWIELLGFYELLEAIAISEPEFHLRQAMIYRMLDEPAHARSLLLALQANDNGLDPQWTEALDLQLAETAPEQEPIAVPVNAIPISRRGDHYLIETTLNNRQQVILMIDTGASITSLSKTSFARLSHANFDRRGSRLFNTANGVARGEVYRAASIALGDTRIDGVDVAILDYKSPDGVDGLLGMNVLRNYRFEIDQDKELLFLRPR